MEIDMRNRVAGKIQSSLGKSTKNWVLICDTDGDRRPSPMTMLAYKLCEFAIVPLRLSKSDLDRTETMLGVMNEFREKGQISTRVAFVVWNMVSPIKDAECQHKNMKLDFTPTKVNLDLLETCNERLFGFSNELPGLFVHHGSDENTFWNSSTVVMREIAENVQKPAEEFGVPVITMVDKLATSKKTSLKFQSPDSRVTYEANAKVIDNVEKSIATVEQMMANLSIA